ncbi:hypothetical protein T484DRAFT_1774888, partial [Baffinella frigidus]
QGGNKGATQLLRVRHVYAALLDEIVAKARNAPREGHGAVMDQAGVATVACFLTFSLLANGLHAGLEAFESVLSRIFPEDGDVVAEFSGDDSGVGAREGASWPEEELWVFMHSLLLHHEVHSFLPPAVLRPFLLRSLTRFPANVILFQALIRLQHRTGLAHDLRSYWERVWDTPQDTNPSHPASHARGILERALQRLDGG